MNILEQAAMLSGKIIETDKIPDVSAPIEPVEKESQASAILSEMEQRLGFDRSQPSMEYKGSQANEDYVRNNIWCRYGEEEAIAYEPCVQVKPRTEWLKNGFVVKDGQEPLCWVLTKRKGQTVNVAVYHQNQVKKA